MKTIIYFFINLFYYIIYCENSFCRLFSSKEWIYKQKTWTNNKVIYKCITNNYDDILNPKYLNYEYDYILFSDKYFNDNENIWEYYPIPNIINNLNLSSIKLQRYIKINPHKCLPFTYNFSIYVDGNIIIKKNLNLLIDKLKYKSGNFYFYLPKHPERNCLYKEINAVLKYKRDCFKNLFPQLEKFIKEGFPHDYGLPETNVLIRYHLNSKIIKLMNDWWNILFKGSHRDQLSFSYVAWKNNNIKFAYIDRKLFKEFFSIKRHKKKRKKF